VPDIHLPFKEASMLTKRMFTCKSAIGVALVAAVAAGTAAQVMAETRWQQNHPRREQVNERLANQNRRIHQEVKEGEVTRQQAGKLHREDRQIRQEERNMASQNGGHITKSEQRVLNQQENAVSRQIGQ
jgi:hypothetical protein